MLSNVIVVGALTCCTLLHSMRDLKAAQLNMQYSPIQELLLYKYELSHNVAEATKNIYDAKGEDTVDHNTVTKWLKKFCSGCMNLSNEARSIKPKTGNSKAVLQAIEANPVSSTQRVSGELDISQSSVICYLHDLGKDIQNCWIASRVT